MAILKRFFFNERTEEREGEVYVLKKHRGWMY